MYVVILAGGGGTRLWPLSRPERPKPFLPLLGDESLLQRTVARIAPLVDDGRHLLRDRPALRPARPRPGARTSGLIVEPRGQEHRRRDRPGDRRHRPAGRRGDARPAGRPDDRRSEDVFRRGRRGRHERLATGRVRHRGAARHPRDQADRPVDRIRLPPAGHDARRADRRRPGLPAARASRRSRPRRGPRADQHAGRRLERRACSSGVAGRSGPRSRSTRR